jgi:hypothetical protein
LGVKFRTRAESPPKVFEALMKRSAEELSPFGDNYPLDQDALHMPFPDEVAHTRIAAMSLRTRPSLKLRTFPHLGDDQIAPARYHCNTNINTTKISARGLTPAGFRWVPAIGKDQSSPRKLKWTHAVGPLE